MKCRAGLKFRLYVGPEGDRVANVGSAISPGISVRSKRNKRTLSPGRRSTQQQELVRSPESQFSTPERETKHLKTHFPTTDVHVAINHISEWSREVSNILPTLNWTLLGKDMLRPTDFFKHCISKTQ